MYWVLECRPANDAELTRVAAIEETLVRLHFVLFCFVFSISFFFFLFGGGGLCDDFAVISC